MDQPETAVEPLPADAETGSSCGAPPGNENATKAGVIGWVRSGKLPRAYKALKAELVAMGEQIAEEVVRLKGREPTVYERAVISSAVTHQGRLALLQRWLAKEYRTMPLAERLTTLKEIGAATNSRDKSLRDLGIDADLAAGSIAATLYPALNHDA